MRRWLMLRHDVLMISLEKRNIVTASIAWAYEDGLIMAERSWDCSGILASPTRRARLP